MEWSLFLAEDLGSILQRCGAYCTGTGQVICVYVCEINISLCYPRKKYLLFLRLIGPWIM